MGVKERYESRVTLSIISRLGEAWGRIKSSVSEMGSVRSLLELQGRCLEEAGKTGLELKRDQNKRYKQSWQYVDGI